VPAIRGFAAFGDHLADIFARKHLKVPTVFHERPPAFKANATSPYGHQGVAVVERAGAAVTRVRAGDRLVMLAPSCGACSCGRGTRRRLHRCAAGGDRRSRLGRADRHQRHAGERGPRRRRTGDAGPLRPGRLRSARDLASGATIKPVIVMA
jgi:hypothetical protein